MATSEKGISTSLNAKTIGSGFETIVLAHGYGSDQSFWDRILPSLAEKYLLVLFDWPFSGAVEDHSLYDPEKYSSFEAYADDLITLMDEMNLKASTFIGHSMSGIIGCIASTKRPDLFKRLMLLGASPRFSLLFLFYFSFSFSKSLYPLLIVTGAVECTTDTVIVCISQKTQLFV